MKFDPLCLQRGDSIGHGSFGSVFKAMHPETGMVIAVKDWSHHWVQPWRSQKTPMDPIGIQSSLLSR